MFVVPQSSQESSSETRPRRDSSVLGSSCEANPFVDPPADHPPPISFSDVEIIRRPFSPTLHDEMSVSAGDRVHVVRMFDDGWALVEKVLAGSPSHDGKGKQVLPQAGLIPIDCLREIWQPLEAFLQDNDVSRYSGTGVAI
ncbi:uncharacterized protein BT62DRAFT_896801 [Guyanagaster necrorhizus]|uniref:SH3 domain-containing protein n=1 Tax=Guyanagaster necrorhizus TaxID=856835 RepID=A0A9P8ARV1_9AGAR|nr:uncharacterized protein BT62DRAFT_896801 [Guyanagaster necrorhizus MCA 3950]KAG7445594.1 hypothetical protein BT62DRAFT_896801 [Guyanagaster necrorhizus MCA 3950]